MTTPESSRLIEVFDSIAAAIDFHSRDWSIDHRDAWIYGIVVGWGDALDEVAARHKWSPMAVERLRKRRATVQEITGKSDDK